MLSEILKLVSSVALSQSFFLKSLGSWYLAGSDYRLLFYLQKFHKVKIRNVRFLLHPKIAYSSGRLRLLNTDQCDHGGLRLKSSTSVFAKFIKTSEHLDDAFLAGHSTTLPRQPTILYRQKWLIMTRQLKILYRPKMVDYCTVLCINSLWLYSI